MGNMRKIILIAGVVLLLVLLVLFAKPRQEQITPAQAAASSPHDPAYLAMIAQNMVSGGPDKDGIPAIDAPVFVRAAEADAFVKPGDTVFGVVVDGVAKAYPQNILYWHEVVNDEINGQRFSVTYCPLTEAVIGYEGRDLGVSGKLYNSNLVLYDRATDSEIPQMLGTAVDGPLKGETLDRFPVTVTTWTQWKAAHPDTLVLSRETGHDRDYDRNPYPGYDTLLSIWFPVAATSDRFPSKKIVTGIELNGGFLAVPKEEFKAIGSAETELGGQTITFTYHHGLDTITAAADDGTDVLAFDSYWFAWYAFHPDTDVFTAGTDRTRAP